MVSRGISRINRDGKTAIVEDSDFREQFEKEEITCHR